MSSEFAELHESLRGVARDILSKSSVDWRLVAESGWLGLDVAEHLGGAGVTFAETAVVLEEVGRAAAPGAYLGSAVLATAALRAVDVSPERDALLGAVVAGETIAAVAVPSDERALTSAVAFTLDGGVLNGSLEFVVDAPLATRLLVVADSDEGPVLVDVDPASPGVTVTPRPLVDATRSLGSVQIGGLAVDAGQVHRFTGSASGALAALLDRAALAVAIDSLGAADAMLKLTVEYLKVREQFGRPIGSFQAVKHILANMHIANEISRQLVSGAVSAVALGEPEASVAASQAKSQAGEAAVWVVGQAMQLHGGIGYTWEGRVHVYLKRVALNRSLFGDVAEHRNRLAARYSL